MVVRQEVFGQLTVVADGFAADAVADVGLLHQHVTAVFLAGENVADHIQGPLRLPRYVEDLFTLQRVLDHPKAGAGQVLLINPSDHLGLLGDDLRFIVIPAPVAV